MPSFAGVVILASLAAVVLAGEAPAPRVVQQDSFSVVGITIRTTNAKESTADGQIGMQWQEFFQDGVLAKIPNKTGANIYAVYSDYAAGKSGEYSVTLGAKVPEGSDVPEGMVLKKVPAGNYAVVTTEKGFVVKVVVAAWQRVWTLEDEHKLARAYKADFELYDQRAADPQNSQADIYIGVK